MGSKAPKEMKVLMFGWEFPPHISGGLGTACQGLAQALTQDHVQILFVVPKTHGDETRDIHILDASAVPIPIHEVKKEYLQQQLRKHGFLSIQAPAVLDPYALGAWGQPTPIQQWNYELATAFETKTEPEFAHFPFTGTYGPDLLEEVNRYAQVASTIASQTDFDVIHVHDWLTYPAGMAAKRKSHKPLIAHVHATEFDRGGQSFNQKIAQVEEEGLWDADHIVTVSQWTKNILLSHYGLPEHKITVVHNGVEKRSGNGPISIPPINKDVVTFLGRVTHQKGPRYFIEAAVKVLKKYPDTHFVMAGSGDLLPEMAERIARLRLSSHFHFTGFLNPERMEQLWAVTRVYVMPSVSEPFGITPLEAIQAGVPVIVSNQSGVAEIMKNIIKVDFWNTDALAHAIVHLLKNKNKSERLKQLGHEEIKGINWENAARKIKNIYHEATAS